MFFTVPAISPLHHGNFYHFVSDTGTNAGRGLFYVLKMFTVVDFFFVWWFDIMQMLH